MFWKRKNREPKFAVGDGVLWQIVPGGRLWPCTVVTVEPDRQYVVRPDVDASELRLARETELRAAQRRGEGR